MLSNRPVTPPDVYGEIVDFDTAPNGMLEVFYKIRTGEIKSWKQPTKSCITVHNFPFDWLLTGVEFAAWSQDISTTRKKEYDWIFIAPLTPKLLREIHNSQMTPLTRKLKTKNLIAKIQTHQNTFNDLFSEIKDLLDADE